MSTALSRLARYYTADFSNAREMCVTPAGSDWHEIWDVFFAGGADHYRVPSPSYVMTKEFEICLTQEVSPAAVEYLFADGPRAEFWFNLPQKLLSTIVKVGRKHGLNLQHRENHNYIIQPNMKRLQPTKRHCSEESLRFFDNRTECYSHRIR